MAGDWIKMRTDLLTSPKVVRMASALKADRFRIAGGLLSVWSLFDVHSVDGTLSGYSLETLDDMSAWPGFSQAMSDVGWLIVNGESLELPAFDTHNGASAKRRAQDADRKRVVRKMSACEADKKRTREEIEKSNISPSLRSGDSADAPAPEPKPSKSRVSITAQQMVATLPGLTAEVAGEYLQYRSSKRAKLTPNAWAVIATEIVKSGMRPDAAMAEAMAAGWQGLKASWLANRETGQQGGGFKTAQEKRADRNAQIFDYEAQMRTLEGITR